MNSIHRSPDDIENYKDLSKNVIMPEAKSLHDTLAIATQAAASSTEATRKREDVNLSFLDDKPALTTDKGRNVSMFDNVDTEASDEEEEENDEAQEEVRSLNSKKGSSVYTDSTVETESSLEEEEEEEDEEDENDKELMELMAHLEELTVEVETLREEGARDKASIKRLSEDNDEKDSRLVSLQEKYRLAQVDYEAAISRIKILRQAVEDNYRERQAEIKRLKQEIGARDERREQRRLAKQRHASTNIVCSVCAIRAFNNTGEGRGTGASAQFAETQDHNEYDTLTSRSGADKEALPQEAGEYILTAKPRNINANQQKNKKTDSARERERQMKLQEEIRQHEKTVEGLQWKQDPHPFWDQRSKKALMAVTLSKNRIETIDAAKSSRKRDGNTVLEPGLPGSRQIPHNEGITGGKDSKFRALNRIPGSDSKIDKSTKNRDQEQLQEELHRALSGMIRGKQSKEVDQRMAQTHAAATAQRQQLEKVKKLRPKSSGAEIQVSENLDKLQPALSNRALQPIGLASREV